MERIPNTAASNRFIARQPILDASRMIYGYEMLFRSGHVNAFSGSADDASRDVIDQCLLLMPNPGTEFAFVNCTRNTLVTGIVTVLPPASTVIELLENIDPDPELMECCRTLKKRGYRFALDDFSIDESKRPFLEIADFIKIDFLASDAAQRRAIYTAAAGSKTTLLAEKVESGEDVQRAQAEGCTLFQGYFFSKPVILTSRAIPQNYAVYLRLLAALSRSPTNISEVEALVLSDASLCYRLLRLVNSALYALPAPIASIRSALLFIGDDEVRKAVTVAMAGLAGGAHSTALVQMALERARFCELLAPLINASASRMYLLGMLSLMDVILGAPMVQILGYLPIDREMKAALLGEKSLLSVALKFVQSHELGDWKAHRDIQEALGISDDAASTIYMNALQWADETRQACGT